MLLRRIMSDLKNNAKRYLLTHCEPYYIQSSNPDDDAVIGWRPIPTPIEYEFFMESVEVVEPIRIKGFKKRSNSLGYRTRYDELHNHFKEFETKTHGTYLIEKEFKIVLWRTFPNLTHEVENFEYMKRDKDGKHIINLKTGEIVMIKGTHDIIVGIKFYPNGLPKE